MEPTDSELLMQFVRHRQSDALEMLLQKHAGMVLGVCLQILQDRHDAEDAFQATFLILAQRAHKIQKSSSVGAWLHRVAYRTAMRSAKQRQRRRQIESLDDSCGNENDPWVSIAQKEEQTALHRALAEMPTRFRSAIVLCYLQGRTRNQAADELETTEATIKSRLARGRQMLRTRLARRGVMLSAAMLAATTVTVQCKTAAANSLIAATTHMCAATLLQNSKEIFSTQIGSLAKQGIQTMQMTTLSKVAIIACLILLPGISWSLYSATSATASEGGASAKANSSLLALAVNGDEGLNENGLTVVFAKDSPKASGQPSKGKERRPKPKPNKVNGNPDPPATATGRPSSVKKSADEWEREFSLAELAIERDYRLAKLKALEAMKAAKQAAIKGVEADLAHYAKVSESISGSIISDSESRSKKVSILQLRAEELEIDAEILKLQQEAALFQRRINAEQDTKSTNPGAR